MTDAHKTELMLIRLSADLIKEMQAPAASSVALPDVQWPDHAAARLGCRSMSTYALLRHLLCPDSTPPSFGAG